MMPDTLQSFLINVVSFSTPTAGELRKWLEETPDAARQMVELMDRATAKYEKGVPV